MSKPARAMAALRAAALVLVAMVACAHLASASQPASDAQEAQERIELQRPSGTPAGSCPHLAPDGALAAGLPS
jgi:hypothetical protein